MTNIDEDMLLRKFKILRSLDIQGFKDYMTDQGYPEPNDETALLAMHKARVYLHANGGYLSRKIANDSRRWLEINGYRDHIEAMFKGEQ